MKITVLAWCVSFLPILLLIMLLAVFRISTARAAGVTLLLTVLSALFHLCDLPRFSKADAATWRYSFTMTIPYSSAKDWHRLPIESAAALSGCIPFPYTGYFAHIEPFVRCSFC